MRLPAGARRGSPRGCRSHKQGLTSNTDTPEEIRKRLGLEAGTQFVVIANKDTVLMKAISPPSMDEFSTLIVNARKQARKAGLKRAEVKSVISEVRSGK